MVPSGPSVAAAPPPAGGSRCMRRLVVWLRRDLRLEDNPALCAALAMADEVVPLFIWSPEEEGQFQPGRCSRWWLASSLAALEQSVGARGSRLVFLRGPESRSVLVRAAGALGAQGVLFNHLYDPISMVRDNEVKAALSAAGLFCHSFNADVLREPWEVSAPGGTPHTAFDPFWAAHCGAPGAPPPSVPAPEALPPVDEALAVAVGALSLKELGLMTPEEELSNVQLDFHWEPGCAGAHRMFEQFVEQRLPLFDADRAKTDRNSTSRLSPYIHFGEISVRHMYHVVKQKEAEWASAGKGGTAVADFLRQMGYREYSRYLSFHFPFTHERSLLEHLRAVPWRFDQTLFKAWRQGRTGWPLVDAAMRELWSTGWMHNRMRVVAASFLVKRLLLPWQWGLKHYWDALLDADLECDALGWQYVAGCMEDAPDFSTVIDQGEEAKRFDPEGNYVRRWLPVLARLPGRFIHEPWLAPLEVLEDAGVELGVNYPCPVVSMEESAAALAAAKAVVDTCARGSGGGEVSGPSGPFRPPTEAEPEVAQRVFAEHYRYSAQPQRTQQSLPEGSAASEEVFSNVVQANKIGALPRRRGQMFNLQPTSSAAVSSAAGAWRHPAPQQHHHHQQQQQPSWQPGPAVKASGSSAGARGSTLRGSGHATATGAIFPSMSEAASGAAHFPTPLPLGQALAAAAAKERRRHAAVQLGASFDMDMGDESGEVQAPLQQLAAHHKRARSPSPVPAEG